MDIGKRIKALRKDKKMKLQELSAASGVQIATLSRMEHGKMTGTIASHMDIARALGVELIELYVDEDWRFPKITELQSESFSYNDSSSYQFLTEKLVGKKMLPLVFRIEAGGRTQSQQYENGTERFLFVLEGDVDLHIADKTLTIKRDQTLYFNANLQHVISNAGPGPAKILSVITPSPLHP